MKSLVMLGLLLGLFVLTGCENTKTVTNEKSSAPAAVSETTIVDQLVEASCGQCQFGMEGDGCNLAVRFDGKSYYVDGTSIDDHGDAHGDDGLCNCIRKAKITGEIKDGRLVATAFEVLPAEKSKDNIGHAGDNHDKKADEHKRHDH